jgi:hypothetical protein
MAGGEAAVGADGCLVDCCTVPVVLVMGGGAACVALSRHAMAGSMRRRGLWRRQLVSKNLRNPPHPTFPLIQADNTATCCTAAARST